MGEYSSTKEVLKAVEDNGGIMTMTMGEIRDACGFERLRSNVVDTISRKLHAVGLGHYPRTLPEDQNRPVRLYTSESMFGEWFEAALRPGEDNDAKLKGLLDLFNNKTAQRQRKALELAEKLVDVLNG